MKTPLFGNITNPSEDIVKEIRDIYKSGFDFVEIGIEAPEGAIDMLRIRRKQIKQELKKFRHPPIAHTAWFIDLGSPYPDIRRGWINELKDSIDVAKLFGCRLLNVHFISQGSAFFKTRKRTNETIDRWAKSLNALSKYAKKKGMMVMLENAPEMGAVCEMKNYSKVLNKAREVGVHLDIAHANICWKKKELKDFMEKFKKRIVHVHVSDNHGASDEHLPIGRGDMDWKKIVRMLKEIGYDRTITFEIFTSRRDAVASMKRFKRIWTS